jgi:spermidine synthase
VIQLVAVAGPVSTSITPLDEGLTLRRRDGVLEILAGNVVLLSNAALETELEFGRLAATLLPIASGLAPRVLVGGLGFGATLRGALDVLPPEARVVVAEKVRTVARLVGGELAYVGGRPLDDARATVVHEDVADVLAAAGEPWDVILLDVDNGPHWASFRGNARLYSPAGLACARRALAPRGSLAVWSGYPADAFLARLREAGLSPRCIPLRERGRVRARAYVAARAA